ncbi:MAG TPA: hypothetical protein VL027_09385 [Spongiibacteraceae bacterium]|jgi:hypothetical protein|nr:hypothetical protein [Spongiibacteraceae bacterium]HUH38140.1 hypothetical protein [Spongiibacteraceae bacterium]
MKTLTSTLLTLSAALLSAPVLSATANEAFERCHAQLTTTQALAKAPRFHKDVAVKTRDQEYTLMINALADVDGKRTPMKVSCDTDADGQVTRLDLEPGRWRM